jgi:hypothetical protein
LNTPLTRPRPVVVSTTLRARIVSVPFNRGSLLVAVPVYVAWDPSKLSPPATLHVTCSSPDTVEAEKVALALCALAVLAWLAAAMPAPARQRQAIAATIKSFFLGMSVLPLVM